MVFKGAIMNKLYSCMHARGCPNQFHDVHEKLVLHKTIQVQYNMQ